jgi:peroxiredoxin
MVRTFCLLFGSWLLGLTTSLLLPLQAAVKPIATVYIFLADTCPISQKGTLALRELHQQYASRGVQFVGVFPDEQTRPADVILFRKTYLLPFELKIDHGQQITRRWGARITPEAVVVAADGRTVVYQGRIDNSYVALGQRRTVTTAHELADALANISWSARISAPHRGRGLLHQQPPYVAPSASVCPFSFHQMIGSRQRRAHAWSHLAGFRSTCT